MAVQGQAISFAYVDGSTLPATTDPNTVYFIPQVGLYVGSTLIADKAVIDTSELENRIEALEDNEISVVVSGSGNDVLDVSYDDSLKQITITRGTSPYITETDLAPYAQSADVTQEIAEAIAAIPEPDIPEYTIAEKSTPNTGAQKSYQLTKDGTAVGVDIDIPTSVTVPVYSMAESTTTSGYAKTYSLTVDGVETGTKINIPKDLVIESGEVKVVTTADDPYTGAVVGDKYIDITLNDANEDHIYIPVNDLVDTYTAGTGITISNANVISTDPTIIPTKTEVQTMIDNAALTWQVIS